MSELTVVYATSPVELGVADEVIAGLKGRLMGLKADTHAGYEMVRAGIAEVTKYRTGVIRSGKELKADAIAYQKNVNAEVNRVVDSLLSVETPLREEKARVDDEAERLRQEKEEAKALAIESKERAEREAREKEENVKREAEEQERKVEAARLAAERQRLEDERQRLEDERREQQEALEAERLKIVADREEIEKVKRAVEEEVRKEREAVFAAEREAQEKEERVKKAVAEKLRLSQEKAEAAVVCEERKPDREKLEEMVHSLENFEFIPSGVTTEWGRQMCDFASNEFMGAVNVIKGEIFLTEPGDEQASSSDM